MHLNFQTLQGFLTVKLSPQERRRVEAHLATCTICFDQLALLRRSKGMTAAADFVAPPLDLEQRAAAALHHFQARQTERVQTVAYICTQDRQPAVGFRGTPSEHQTLYTTDRHDIDIRQSFDQAVNRFVLHGQILPLEDQSNPLAGIEVRLVNMANLERLRITNSVGEFTFSYVPEGLYSLVIPLVQEDIILKSIVIKPRLSADSATT